MFIFLFLCYIGTLKNTAGKTFNQISKSGKFEMNGMKTKFTKCILIYKFLLLKSNEIKVNGVSVRNSRIKCTEREMDWIKILQPAVRFSFFLQKKKEEKIAELLRLTPDGSFTISKKSSRVLIKSEQMDGWMQLRLMLFSSKTNLFWCTLFHLC